MDKKTISVFVVIVLIVGALCIPQVRSRIPILNKNVPVKINEFVGSIAEVRQSSLVVEAVGTDGAKTNVEFELIPQTNFKRIVIIFTKEQLKASGTFTPETKQEMGQLSDLKAGQNIVVYTKDNLQNNSKAEALQINYVTRKLPQ